MQLNGLKIVVPGAANGLGAYVARRLKEHGACMALCLSSRAAVGSGLRT